VSNDTIPVSVHILDKEYLVSCPAEEEVALQESARYLDARMREVRDSGKVLGGERIAVMTALNLIHELFVHKRENEAYARTVDEAVQRLERKLDVALGRRPREETVD